MLAVLGGSLYDNMLFPLLAAAHIPDIGNGVSLPVDATSRESYPLMTPDTMLDAGLAIELKQAAGCKKIAFIDQARLSTTTISDEAYAAGAKYAKVKFAPAVDVPVTRWTMHRRSRSSTARASTA